MIGYVQTIAVILPKQVRERKERKIDRIKREGHMANTKLDFLNQHTSPAKHVSHSFTHSHTLSCDWICPTYIQTYIHTVNTADGAEASTLPSLLFLVLASCLGWPLSSPSHLNIPDTWLDRTTWSSGAGGAQQHHCCLCDRVGSTASLSTPLSFSSMTR